MVAYYPFMANPSGLNVVVVGKQAAAWIDYFRIARPTDRLELAKDWLDTSLVTAAIVSVSDTSNLERFGNLQLIQSLWMGIDGLLADPTIPIGIPLARMIDPCMPLSMAESVCAHVLWAHRHGDDYQRNQAIGLWKDRYQPLASERTVTMLGLGQLGARCASSLAGLGFHVVGWSRTARTINGVTVIADLNTALAQGEIVVNLLPLTPQTRAILNAQTFSAMPVDSVLVNVGRGAHVVDDDLLSALDSGHLRHAILDVFTTEPLPASHRYWNHEHVTITPHVAADSMPQTCVPVIAENLRRLSCGEPLLNLVDRRRGY